MSPTRNGEPRRQWLVALPIGVIRLYQRLLSPLLPALCRFEPTCSCYAIEALERRGLMVGGALVLSRIIRCNPFSGGGYDPVPDTRHEAPAS